LSGFPKDFIIFINTPLNAMTKFLRKILLSKAALFFYLRSQTYKHSHFNKEDTALKTFLQTEQRNCPCHNKG